MMTPKTLSRYGNRKRQTTYCEAIGCGEFTREGKPYCTSHVAHHSYIKSLLSVLADRAEEEMLVGIKGWKAVNLEGSIIEETIQFLRVHGERTIGRLAKDLNRDKHIQGGFIEALRRAKIVRTRGTSRGTFIVSLLSI